MRLREILLVLGAMLLLRSSASAAPAAFTAEEDKKELDPNAVDLLDVNSDTAHENESNRKARQFFYPYGGFYGGYGGYYGGYGLYGYRLYPSYGYGYGYYPGFYNFYG